MLEFLKDLDFTGGEIKVYEAILKIGESTIGPISKRSGITPSKTYPILEKLLKKGLIGKITMDKTLYFTPNKPERILTYLDEKRNIIEEKKKEVIKELPKLQNLSRTFNNDARILTGIGGVNTFYEEHNRIILKGNKIFKVFSFEEEWKNQKIRDYIIKQDIIRKKLGIEVRVIASKKTKKYMAKEDYKNINIRFTEQNIPVGTIISATQIALFLWKEEPIIFVIDSKDLGEYYEKFFDNMWKQAKK